MTKFKIRNLIVTLILATAITGCKKTEPEQIVIIDKEEDNMAYGLISVTRDDVVLTKLLTCTYTQTKEQAISFPIGGKKISKVLVHEGETVKKGDLLVELAEDNLQAQIDELEYKIAKNELLLGYLDKAEEFDKASAYNSFVYTNKEIEEEDVTKYDEKEDSIKQDYDYKREDYNDEIEFDKKKLSQLKTELSNSKIYSNMNGTVLKITDDLEGSTSRKDEVVMTVVDNASGFFETQDPAYAEYFHEGEVVEMNVVYGEASGDYELIPYNMGSWGDVQQFEIVSQPENEGIEVGTSGTLKVIMDKKEQVLSLPLGAIYYADSKPYVYTLDENNFRNMVWIEVGLIGDSKAEILGGLSEGDKVVYK